MQRRRIKIGGCSVNIDEIPIGNEYILKIPKYQVLESYFEEDILGYPKDSICMYRGPHNIHILEYDDYYAVHRDRCDPRYDPLGHIDEDVPELKPVIATGLVLGGIALTAYLLSKYDDEY